MSGIIGPKIYNLNSLIFYTNPDRKNNLIEIKTKTAATLNGTTDVGSSILFNGTTDFITFPFYTNLQKQITTIDCWIRPTSIGTDSVLFSVFDWSNYNSGLPARGYALFWNNNTFVFSYGPGTQAPNIVRTSTTVSTLNRWCNIIVTNNLGVTTFYLNGSLLSSAGTTTGVPLDWTYGTGTIPNVSISKKNNNITGGYFKGNIGPIKVYDKILTATEVRQNYNQNYTKFT